MHTLSIIRKYLNKRNYVCIVQKMVFDDLTEVQFFRIASLLASGKTVLSRDDFCTIIGTHNRDAYKHMITLLRDHGCIDIQFDIHNPVRKILSIDTKNLEQYYFNTIWYKLNDTVIHRGFGWATP